MSTSPASRNIDESEKRDGQDEEQRHLQDAGWRALFGFTTRPHLPVLALGVVTTTIAALTLPALAFMYGFIFRKYADYGAGNISASSFLQEITKYCIYIAAIGGFSWLGNSMYFISFLTFGELQARSARGRLFGALLKKDMAWYDEQDIGMAAFLPAMQTQIHDLQLAVSQPGGQALQCLIASIGSLIIAFYSSWKLTLVIVCSIPIMYLVMTYLSKLLARRANEQSNALGQALKYLTNVVRHIEAVKCYNGERHELQRYGKVIALAGSLFTKQANLRALQLGSAQCFTLSIFFQGFWYGNHQVLEGKANTGQVVTTFWAAMMAVTGVTEFLPQLIILQKGKVAGSRLRGLIRETSEASTETAGLCKPDYCEGHIRFENVSFAYPSRQDHLALRDISMSFPAGEITFVMGRSGSGKSTLGQLLVKFYEPASGSIWLDNTPIHELDVHWLRQKITLVEQHSVLFNDSILGNIALGKIGQAASQLDILDAISFAMLQQVVQDLPQGLDTESGVVGNNLSGGQRQRMALARARLRDTPILILDESTSALDYITRSSILKAIRSWRRGKTTIIITHDITQILPEDFVYIMDKAEVLQYGTRETLQSDGSSMFQTFVNRPTQDEPDESDSEDTEEILMLYADAWSVTTPSSRPTSGIFGQAIFRPLISPDTPEIFSVSRNDSRSDRQEIPAEMSSVPSGYVRGRRLSEARETSRPLSVASLRSTSLARRTPHLRPISIHSARYVSKLEAEADLMTVSPQTQKEKRTFFQRRKVEIIPSTAFYETLSITAILRTVWPLVDWSTRLILILGLICTLIHSAATPVFGYLLAQMMSTFYIPKDQKRLAQTYALLILAVSIIDGLATYGYNFFFELSAQRWANILKSESMKRILFQPREFFDREENSVPKLAECLDQFAEEARNLPGRFFCILIIMFFTVTIAIIWALAICWKLSLVAVACLVGMFAITRIYHAVSTRWEKLSNDANEGVSQVLHETFVNIRTVRCLALEDVFRKKYGEATTNALNVGVKRAIFSGSIFGLNYASAAFVTALLFWWGAYLISKDEVSTTDVITTFNVLMLSVAHANHVGVYIPQINVSKDAASRLMRLAKLPQDSHELSGTEQLFTAGDIVFKNVNFTYPTRKEHQVLHNVNFSIPKGSCTALVGISGSGKSTIAALLTKLYQTETAISRSAPEISISNYDIKGLHTSTLRTRLAIVSQTPVLFPGTITENITYGLDPSSSLTRDDNIRAAAFAAGCDEFIESLPQGYQTLVGDGGTGLSGGQAQRIAIARALIRCPDILVLDEATSALDVESAGIVRDTIQRLVRESKGLDTVFFSPTRSGEPQGARTRLSQVLNGKSITVVIITHARDMMSIADWIVMLDKGKVVEQGGFGELRRRRGPFARLLSGEAGDA